MYKIHVVVFLSFLAIQGFSQTLIGLYGGGGCATSNNYDIAPSGGIQLLFGNGYHIRTGATLFYQAYSLYADNEANSSTHGTGNAGTIDRIAASYVFLAPKVYYGIGKSGNFGVYLNVGVGYNINGFDSLRKFDRGYYNNGYYTTYNSGIGQYDSSLDKTSNLNKMLFRVGFGLSEHIYLSHSWFISFSEDFGFLTSDLTTTGTSKDPSRTQFSRSGLRPGYVSLHIGITHRGKPKTQ